MLGADADGAPALEGLVNAIVAPLRVKAVVLQGHWQQGSYDLTPGCKSDYSGEGSDEPTSAGLTKQWLSDAKYASAECRAGTEPTPALSAQNFSFMQHSAPQQGGRGL